MARATLALSLLAMLCASVVAQSYVEVLVKWDNNEAETRRADSVVQRYLAQELCKVPQSQVRTLRIERRRDDDDDDDDDDEDTWGYYACGVGAPQNQLNTILNNCRNDDNQDRFEDRVEDNTNPDLEEEDITCTLK